MVSQNLRYATAEGVPFVLTTDRFKDACTRAEIVPAITFHELRHAWASLSIMAGAPLMVVAQNLGHSDTRMVEKHYGHLAHSFVAETIRRTAPSFHDGESAKVVRLRKK